MGDKERAQKRFTKYDPDIGYYVLEPFCQTERVKHYSEGVLDIYQGDAIDKLAEYEDALEQQEQNTIKG